MLTNNEMAILTIYEQVLCFKWAKFWHDQKVFPLIHYIYIFKKLTQGCFSFNPVVFRKHNILFFFRFPFFVQKFLFVQVPMVQSKTEASQWENGKRLHDSILW